MTRSLEVVMKEPLTCTTAPVDKKETTKFRISLTMFSIFAAVSFN